MKWGGKFTEKIGRRQKGKCKADGRRNAREVWCQAFDSAILEHAIQQEVRSY
jgi:hypothetical protein